jgi:hypothetical protein
MRSAEAASMLTELNRDAPDRAVEQDEAKAVEVEAPEPVSAATDRSEPAPMVERDHADTAMLLRELSSLGFSDDDNRPTPPSPRAPRSAPPGSADKGKKRKGLFGR